MANAFVEQIGYVTFRKYKDVRNIDIWEHNVIGSGAGLSDDAIIAHGELSDEMGGRELYFAPFLEDVHFVKVWDTRPLRRRSFQLLKRSLQLGGNLEVVNLAVYDPTSMLLGDFTNNLLRSNPRIRDLGLSTVASPSSSEEAYAFWRTIMKPLQNRIHSLRKLQVSVGAFRGFEYVVKNLAAACLEKQKSQSMWMFQGGLYYPSFGNGGNMGEIREPEWHKAILAKRKLFIGRP